MSKNVNEALEKLYNEVMLSNRQYRFILDRDEVWALVQAWKSQQSQLDSLPEEHCQNGRPDVCLAASENNIVCPADSCDIDDGIRSAPCPKTNPRRTYEPTHR